MNVPVPVISCNVLGKYIGCGPVEALRGDIRLEMVQSCKFVLGVARSQDFINSREEGAAWSIRCWWEAPCTKIMSYNRKSATSVAQLVRSARVTKYHIV